MEQNPEQVLKNPEPTEEKNNLASRVIAATFFAKLFAGVLNNPGQIIDANRVFQGEKMTITEKVSALFTTGFWSKLSDQHRAIRAAYPKNPIKGFFIASNRVGKYTIITSVIGGAIGAVLGWSLGDRIKDSKDLYKHPWKSTKILLGIDKPQSEQDEIKMASASSVIPQDNNPAKTSDEPSTAWRDFAKEQQNQKAQPMQHGVG